MGVAASTGRTARRCRIRLVAPLMAVAEERGLSGAQLIEAYLVGIETGSASPAL